MFCVNELNSFLFLHILIVTTNNPLSESETSIN